MIEAPLYIRLLAFLMISLYIAGLIVMSVKAFNYFKKLHETVKIGQKFEEHMEDLDEEVEE